MLITLKIDKEKLKLFLESDMFNETIFDTDTRVIIVKECVFSEEDSNLLSMLAHDDSKKVRKLVALHEYTPEDTLEELSFDDSDEVRESLAKNINLPEDILEDLAYDDSQNVRDIASLRINAEVEKLS